MAIPTKPSIRQTHRGRQVRVQREYYSEPSSSVGSSGYSTRLIWSFVKIAFMILGAIAGMAFVGWLLIQFIIQAVPISLIAIGIMGLIIWLIVKHA